MKRVNYYTNYLREIYGERVQKISVDAGFTCPNRDGLKGYGGCTFCNNDSFSGGKRELNLKEQIKKGINKYELRGIKRFLVYFQSYTNTYAPLEKLKEIYETVLEFPQVVGIVIGTRPDCLTSDLVSYLEEFNQVKDVTIEIGAESMHDETLKKINRGHTRTDFLNSFKLFESSKIKIGTHLILGFPWETEDQIIESVKSVSELPITFLKLHQLHIVKKTALGNEYLNSPFKTMSQDEYFKLIKEVIKIIPPNIIIQRFFGFAPDEMLISPSWGKSVAQLNQELEQYLLKENIIQGQSLSLNF